MSERHASDRESFLAILETAEKGDCIRIDRLASVAGSSEEMLEAAAALAEKGADLVCAADGIDTRTGAGRAFFEVCRLLRGLDGSRPRRRDGIEKAKEEGRYKGRKPISIDEGLFDSVVSLWRNGQITAREAMSRLDLKPNTFYRRIKEREERKMKDYKQVGNEIKEELRGVAEQGRRDLDDLKKQVKADLEEVRKAADEKLELHDAERERIHDRIRAEVEHAERVRKMKKDVEAEAEELKKLMENGK